MFLETAHTPVQPASASLIHEMMGQEGDCGDFLVLMKSQEANAFMQFAVEDETSGILEYRDEETETLYRCTRPVTKLEAETALIAYLNGGEDWKGRFQWEEVNLNVGALKFFENPWVLAIVVLGIVLFYLYKRGFFNTLLG